MHRLQFVVYKFILRTLFSSLVLLNTRVWLLSYSKDLSYNIKKNYEIYDKELLVIVDNICWMPQKGLKSRLIMKTLSILENYTNLMDNKQDSISSCKTIILFYNTF